MSTYTGVTNFQNSPAFWPTLYLLCDIILHYCCMHDVDPNVIDILCDSLYKVALRILFVNQHVSICMYMGYFEQTVKELKCS